MRRQLFCIVLVVAACVPPSREPAAETRPAAHAQQALTPNSFYFSPPLSGSAAIGAGFGHAVALLRGQNSSDRAQLVVGAPGANGGAGQVFLFSSVPQGTAVLASWSPQLGNGSTGFGSALATGDFNGDRIMDLVVGAPGDAMIAGTASLFLGQPDGGLSSVAQVFANPGGTALSGSFGAVLAMGDMNGDGKADVAVAATGANVVAVYLGGSSVGAPLLFSVGEPASLAWVNLDADGGEELLVGSSLTDSVSAYGYDAGIVLLAVRAFMGPDGSYGAALASWQNTSSKTNVMIGAPTTVSGSIPVGATYSVEADTLLVPSTAPGPELKSGSTVYGQRFGAAMASVGHFDGDPNNDLFIGAPGALQPGVAYLFSLPDAGAPALLWSDAPGSPADSFGCSVAGGLSLTSGHASDVVVGAEGWDGGEGLVYVYYGTAQVVALPDAGVDCSDSSCPVCQQCVGGACVAVAVDPACTGGTFCNPLSCQAGACVAPSFCTYDCSESEMRCFTQNQAEIVDDASRSATVGLAYQYNQTNTVTVKGTQPIDVISCGSPTGFTVVGGVVSWTPTAPGLTSVCIKAANNIGEDQLVFSVVVNPAGTAPMAKLQVTPTTGQVPLQVQVDGTMSQSAQTWSWDFGDMSSPVSGPIADHDYLLPGSYPVTLTVSDGMNSNTARQVVSVLDAAGNVPPTAHIVPGPGGSFTCDCAAGSSDLVTYAWDLEDRTVLQQTLAPQTYPSGLHRLRLRVIDANGLVGNDAMFFEGDNSSSSNAELHCLLSVDPPAGNAPLSISWSTQTDDASASTVLTLAGSTPADVTAPVAQSCPTPGVYRAQLVALAPANNLKCTDFAYATATAEGGEAPVITPFSPPLAMACTGTFTFQPMVAGTRPITFTLQGPAGAQVDSATGKLTWQAPLTAEYQLTGANDAGSAQFTFDINDSCDDVTPLDGGAPLPLPTALAFETKPCGCGSGDASVLALAALLVLERRRTLSR